MAKKAKYDADEFILDVESGDSNEQEQGQDHTEHLLQLIHGSSGPFL